MRADVQKPIQSLHAIGRHYSGGSIAALPPISLLRDWTVIIIGIIFTFVSLLSAQEADSNRQVPAEGKKLDQLFDQIIQSMPDEAREQVDSAASLTVDHEGIEGITSTTEQRLYNETNTARIGKHELPEEIKEQVERTIADMQQRKVERKAQFRESRKNNR